MNLWCNHKTFIDQYTMNSLYRTKSFQSVTIRTKPFYWFSKSRWLYWGTSSYMKLFSTTVALNHVHIHLRHPTRAIYLYHVFSPADYLLLLLQEYFTSLNNNRSSFFSNRFFFLIDLFFFLDKPGRILPFK